MTRDISSSADIIDVRDLIPRFEELEEERNDLEAATHEDGEEDTNTEGKKEELAAWDEGEEGEEFQRLKSLLEELEGSGGDEQWRGSWYPIVLIRDSHFRDYAEQYADDVGAIDKNSNWPLSHIDWDAAAENLKQDYSSVEYDGVTYWYR